MRSWGTTSLLPPFVTILIPSFSTYRIALSARGGVESEQKMLRVLRAA